MMILLMLLTDDDTLMLLTDDDTLMLLKSPNSLEPSMDNSLAKVPRMLRCCHLDGLNQTDQHKVDASLIYADRH